MAVDACGCGSLAYALMIKFGKYSKVTISEQRAGMERRSAPRTGLMVISLLLVSAEVRAIEDSGLAQIWGGIDIGGGNVKTSADVGEDNTALYLGFKLGYKLNPHYSLGLELNGWTLESGDLWDPSKGGGISQVLIITQFYPNIESDFYLKIGGGYVSHWNNRIGEPAKKSGWGITLGGGYDFPLNEDWAVTPFLIISSASIDDEDHDAWALGIGITRQF